jgi:hypothetical protein
MKDATSERVKPNLVHDFFECFSKVPYSSSEPKK